LVTLTILDLDFAKWLFFATLGALVRSLYSGVGRRVRLTLPLWTNTPSFASGW
jgi:hypothetical protein